MSVYRYVTQAIGTSGTTSSTAGAGSTVSVLPLGVCGGGTTTASTTACYSTSSGSEIVLYPHVPDDIEISDGRARKITMPDGAVIRVEADGSYVIDDADAKVVYRACRVRDFNTFLNASDKIEEFVRYCGEVGVRQGDVLEIPIRQFVQWLVIEAAKADGEEPQPLLLPDLRTPRCPQCGRFMSPLKKAKRIEYCRVQCFERANNQIGATK